MASAEELKGIPMFSKLTDEQLAPFAQLAREMTCPAGQLLFREGDEASEVYLLLDGRVTIQVSLSSRPESIAVASLHRHGQLVGWSGLVSTNYTASAYCENDCHLLAINGQAFHTALQRDPAAGFHVMEHIASVIGERLRNIQRVVLKTL